MSRNNTIATNLAFLMLFMGFVRMVIMSNFYDLIYINFNVLYISIIATVMLFFPLKKTLLSFNFFEFKGKTSKYIGIITNFILLYFTINVLVYVSNFIIYTTTKHEWVDRICIKDQDKNYLFLTRTGGEEVRFRTDLKCSKLERMDLEDFQYVKTGIFGVKFMDVRE